MFRLPPLLPALSLLLLPHPAGAEVTGRYVRYESPTDFRDFLFDLEVFSKGSEVGGDRKVEATAYRGTPWPEQRLRHIVDGKLTGATGAKRPPLFEAKDSPTNVCVEVDFGAPREIDEVKVSRATGFNGPIRIVTVLDENRKVVGSSLLTLTPGTETDLVFRPAADGPYVGETVPKGPGGWLPFAGLLPDHEVARGDAARAAAFAERDDAAHTAALAKRFFGMMDLSAPHLAEVKAAFDAGKFLDALALYRDLWFRRIADTENLWGHEIPGAYYAGEAEDLLAGKFSTTRFRKGESPGVMVAYEPGLIPWGYLPGGELGESFLSWNRDSALANRFARPLLTAYRETGDVRFLDRWEAVTDDLTLNFSAAADSAMETDLRDFFAKETLQNWNFFLFELADTAKAQPDFVKTLSPQTLARLLLFAQEEYLAPYWRTVRKTAFNHTFNALNAAYFAVESFRDFSAGKRLMRETQDHFERVTSYNTTRDGSMTEVGDDGHISMHMRLGTPLRHMLATKPDWISPALLRQLQDRYAEMTRFQIRHMTSAGLTHRGSYQDGFTDAFLDVDSAGRTYGGMSPLPMYQDAAVYRDPAVRAVFEAAFPDGPEAAAVRKFYAAENITTGEPVTSDTMPYTGLSYLRNHWGPGGSSAHLVSTPVNHPSANTMQQNRLWFMGKGSAMVSLDGIILDREQPDQELGQVLAKPGSKTERLTESSPLPVPARFLASKEFDLAEGVWSGPYGKTPLDGSPPHHPFEKVEARRVLLLYRPADLWVVADRVDAGGNGPRNYRFKSAFTIPASAEISTEENGLRVPTGEIAGIDARFVASTPLEVKAESGEEKGFSFRGKTFPKSLEFNRREVEILGGGGGAFAALTVLQPIGSQDQAGQIKALTNLPEGGAGFEVPLPGGGTLAVLAVGGAPAKLTWGPVSAKATLLVVARKPDGVSGIAFDAEGLTVNQRAVALPAKDATFTVAGTNIATSPILRPLQPPVFSPTTPVFVGEQSVTLTTPDRDARLYYTTDGSDPVPGSATTRAYEGPIPLTETTLIKARSVREPLPPGGLVPFRADGTTASIIVPAAYTRETLQPAASAGPLRAGLKMEFLHGSWLRLFSFLDQPGEMPAEKTTTAASLLNPQDFKALRDGDRFFGVRYSGFLDVPKDGVYTFHLPKELARHRSAVPGYDLQVHIDGKTWNPDFTWQGGGTWSVPLARGPHPLLVTFAEARTREKISPHTGLWRGFPSNHVVWKGDVPELKVSGPGIEAAPIPTSWLKHP